MKDPTVDECELCGVSQGPNSDTLGYTNLYGHHTSYYPEALLWVCGSCHAKIHNTDGFYDILNPNIERPDSFRHGSPTGVCDECAFKLRLVGKSTSELDITISDCYHPSEECSSCGGDVNKIKALDDELIAWYKDNL